MRTKRRWRLALWLILALAISFVSMGASRGDDKADHDDLRARIESLEKQNLLLQEVLQANGWLKGVEPSAAERAKGTNSKEGDKRGPSAPEEDQVFFPQNRKERDESNRQDGETKAQWYEVGKSLGLHGVWRDFQPWFETEDQAFRFHVGGRVHLDAVWADADNHVQFGKGGTGAFDDGVNIRRARLTVDGWMYEVVDFVFEVDFTQTVNDDPTMPANAFTNVIAPNSITEAYASLNHLPWIGTIRIGNQKAPILLEHITSSRFLDFMERSPLFDTYINRNNGFQPGIEIANWSDNERLTWQVALMKNTQTIQPFAVGDGDYQVNGRMTGLPWYEAEGRYMIHLGFGIQYDEPDHATAILRDRWLLRNGPPTTQNTVALATLVGHNQLLAVPEFFMNLGPFSIQAEYLAHHMDDITSFATQTQGTVTVKGPPKRFFSQGAYVEVMYFLTGENRPFERTALHAGGARPTRIVPLRNFFWLPGYGCPNPFSAGAWQVGARYSYSDLTNNGINGGQVNEVTLGLNWFLNPNMKIQWNYDVGYRGQLGPGSSSNGTYQGFGTRLAFDF